MSDGHDAPGAVRGGVPDPLATAVEPDITLPGATADPAGDVSHVADEPGAAGADTGGPAPSAGGADADADVATGRTGRGSADLATGRTPDAAAGATEPDGLGADGDPTPPLLKILEAILLVVDEPVPAVDLAQVVERPRADVERALDELAGEYRDSGRGFELRAVAGGWRLYTAADCAAYVERFVLDGQQARLTQAALETLAVIAYRQPVSRQSVAAIRGVNVDGVVRTLLTRGLIAEAGQEGPGGAHLYVTTRYFLERLGLRGLDELPNLAPLLPVNIDDLADQA